MILSACSSYFDELLTQNPCQHPIVLMKDLRFWEIQALVDFMYCGEVNVGQDKLPSLLAAAEALQIKGLAGPASTPGADSLADEDSMPPTYDSDYLERDTPSPTQARRARKRRCSVPTPVQQPPQVVAPPPARPPRPALPPAASGSRLSDLLTPEPPHRRQRLELTPSKIVENLREIKLEPLDIDDDSIPDCEDFRPPDHCSTPGNSTDNGTNRDTNNGTIDKKNNDSNSKTNSKHDRGKADADFVSTKTRDHPPISPGEKIPEDSTKTEQDDD